MRDVTLLITLQVNDEKVPITRFFDQVKYALNIIEGEDITVRTIRNASADKSEHTPMPHDDHSESS